jgi:DNA gyrase/topoisomerase IV subunit B
MFKPCATLYRRSSTTLDDIAKIRKRPGMYAGDIQDGTALHNLVLGMVTLAVAQNQLRPSFTIEVVLRQDGAVSVYSVGLEEWTEDDLTLLANARFAAATSIVDCIQLEPSVFDIAGGVYCDLCVVNALSDWMCDQVWSGASIQSRTFRESAFESTIQAPLFSDLIAYGRCGLSTTFLPSKKRFPSITFDAGRLQDSLADICSRNLEVRVGLIDRRFPKIL